MKRILSLILIGAMTFSFTGCQNGKKSQEQVENNTKKVEEKTTKNTENVGEKVKEGTENTGEKIKEGAEKAGDEVKKQTEELGENLGINKLMDKFKSAGFTLGERENVDYKKLGAKNGYKVKVDNDVIEVYEYDMKNLSEEGKKVVEQAKKGSITMDGKTTPVKFKDGIMLIGVDKHTKRDKLNQIFEEYFR